MRIFIVIPVRNEETHITRLLNHSALHKFPIVIVDDGSTDNSVKMVEKSKNKNLTLLRHDINLGKGSALRTGCDYAFEKGADAVVLMDSDGQHNPDDLPKFINKLNEGYGVVLGSRNLNMGVPFDRYLGNKMASVLIGLLFGIYVSDLICGFRALTKTAYKKMKWESTGYGIEVETVTKIKEKGLKHCEVPVETIYYDDFKGVTVFDAFGLLGNVIWWRIRKIKL